MNNMILNVILYFALFLNPLIVFAIIIKLIRFIELEHVDVKIISIIGIVSRIMMIELGLCHVILLA